MKVLIRPAYQAIIEDIERLNWAALTRVELVAVARAYYYFSVQFRENLEIACALHPEDARLARLYQEECDTDNLSPYRGVALPSEKMDHDEFMRRALELSRLGSESKASVDARGAEYLRFVRGMERATRAMSIASYEDGGLEAVFQAMLLAPEWDDPALRAFRHFLVKHIQFDSDVSAGHGALSRHLNPDDRIAPLWRAFYDILLSAAPSLAG